MLSIRYFLAGIFLLVSIIIAPPLSSYAHTSVLRPYNLFVGTEADKTLRCLTDNIYYEAGNQSVTGKAAVAYTTLNRVVSPQFPNSVCEVVYERNARTCQFTWVCETRRFSPITSNIELRRYYESKQVAIAVLIGYNTSYDPSLGALYYHADYVNPGWKKTKLVQIEDHIFYK